MASAANHPAWRSIALFCYHLLGVLLRWGSFFLSFFFLCGTVATAAGREVPWGFVT